jgi:ribosomal-protein-alanine N-acetyltransferase
MNGGMPPAPVRVHLEAPLPAHSREFLAAVAASRSLHGSWVSPPATRAAYRAHLARREEDDFRSLLIRRNVDNALVGLANLSAIQRGNLQSAYLGFYAFVPYAGLGYMTEGLMLVLRYAFGDLSLHRVEANVQPTNAASLALVRRVGFQREGFSPRYLKIAGAWRDHERWAALADEWPSRPGDPGST